MFPTVREFLGGVGLLARGAGMVLRSPRLFLLGAVPPLITSLLFLGALVALILNITGIVSGLTPFAEDWDQTWRVVLRGALWAGLLIGAVLVMVVAFTTVTLALGSPIYDKIAESVEDRLGGAPDDVPEGRMAAVLRSVRQSVALILLSLFISVLAFALGLVPLLGQVLAPVLSAVLGGWVIALELTAGAFDRRGRLTLRMRHAGLRQRRSRVLGFAVPAFLLLAIPFVAIAVFPAAAAGGTLLTRDVLGVSTEDPRRGAARSG